MSAGNVNADHEGKFDEDQPSAVAPAAVTVIRGFDFHFGRASPWQYAEKREEVSVKLYLVEKTECRILRKFTNAGVKSSRFSPGVPWNRIGGAVPGIRSLDPSKCAKARPKTRGPRASKNSA